MCAIYIHDTLNPPMEPRTARFNLRTILFSRALRPLRPPPGLGCHGLGRMVFATGLAGEGRPKQVKQHVENTWNMFFNWFFIIVRVHQRVVWLVPSNEWMMGTPKISMDRTPLKLQVNTFDIFDITFGSIIA